MLVEYRLELFLFLSIALPDYLQTEKSLSLASVFLVPEYRDRHIT
jgi:hypothetical protein